MCLCVPKGTKIKPFSCINRMRALHFFNNKQIIAWLHGRFLMFAHTPPLLFFWTIMFMCMMNSSLVIRQWPIQPQRRRERHHFKGCCEYVSKWWKIKSCSSHFWEKLWSGGDRTLQSLQRSSNICWTVNSNKIRPPIFRKTSKCILLLI